MVVGRRSPAYHRRMRGARGGLWCLSVLSLAGCSGGAGPGGDDEPPGACSLAGEDLANLTHSFSLGLVAQARPGQTVDVNLGYDECCYFFQKRDDVCAAFSVTPEGAATIDPVTGVLAIPASTPSGTTLHVSADVQDGDRTIDFDLHVYTYEAMPQVGVWTEREVLSCTDGSARAPVEPIGEVVFWADGSYSVTWQPFEIFRDYLGRATIDRSRHGGAVPHRRERLHGRAQLRRRRAVRGDRRQHDPPARRVARLAQRLLRRLRPRARAHLSAPVIATRARTRRARS